MITTIAFDFDGTLVDSIEIMIEVANTLSDKFGGKTLVDNKALRKKSARDIVKEQFGHSWIALARFIKLARPLVKKRLKTVHFKRGLSSLIIELRKEYKVGILTSNDYDTVESVLLNDALKIDFLHSTKSIFGKDRALRKFLKEHRLSPGEVLYIGDEVRDIEACKKAGIPIAAVTWGFNDKDALRKAKPDFLIDTPAQLKKLLSHKTKK